MELVNKEVFYSELEKLKAGYKLFMLDRKSTDTMLWLVMGGKHQGQHAARIDGFNFNEKKYFVNYNLISKVGGV